jgi:hypothetical protein
MLNVILMIYHVFSVYNNGGHLREMLNRKSILFIQKIKTYERVKYEP